MELYFYVVPILEMDLYVIYKLVIYLQFLVGVDFVMILIM